MNLILVMASHSPHILVVKDDPAMKVNFYLFEKRPFKSKSRWTLPKINLLNGTMCPSVNQTSSLAAAQTHTHLHAQESREMKFAQRLDTSIDLQFVQICKNLIFRLFFVIMSIA